MLCALSLQTHQLSFTLKCGSGVAPLIHDVIYRFILATRQSILIYSRTYSINGALTAARTFPFFPLVTQPGVAETRHNGNVEVQGTNPRKGAILAKRDIHHS